MKTDVCGYVVGAVDAETGQLIEAVYGIEPGFIDVGRDDDGELRSFVAVSGVPEPSAQNDSLGTDAPPRLFNPPTSPIPREVIASVGPVSPSGSLVAAVHEWKNRMHKFLTGSHRKTVMFAAGGGLAAVMVALALIPPAGSAKSTAVSEITSTAAVGGSHDPAQPDLSDPQNASIEMALTGAIAGLGNMQGVARSAVKASIASRAGDIVLIDLAVTKPTGLTAFATVLLQKVGSQWRMRQIVDERN